MHSLGNCYRFVIISARVDKIKFTEVLYNVWYIFYDIVYSISDFIVFFSENFIKWMGIYVVVL